MTQKSEQNVPHSEGLWGWSRLDRAGLIALARLSPHNCHAKGCPGPENKRKLEAGAQVLGALEEALLHLEELEEAWARGIIHESDGKGGTRSNRNFACVGRARAAIANAKGERP